MWWLIGLVLFAISIAFFVNNLGVSVVWWISGIGGALLGAGLVLAVPPTLLEVQKILATLVMPTALLWMALLIACYLARTYHRLRWVLLGIAAAFTLLANGWFAHGLIAILESPYTGIKPLSCGRFDAICVLGGGTDRDPSRSPQLSAAGDRLRLAAALYRAGKTRLVVTTGSSIPGVDRERDLSEEAALLCLQLGVPADALVRLPEPENTSREIHALATLQGERDWQDLGLVTSAWHLPRAMALAERFELRVTPLPADFRGGLPPVTPLYLIPQGRFLDLSRLATWEFLGRLVGR